MNQVSDNNKSNPKVQANLVNGESNFVLIPADPKLLEDEINGMRISHVMEAIGIMGIIQVHAHHNQPNTFSLEHVAIKENEDNTVTFCKDTYNPVNFIRAIHKQKHLKSTPEHFMKKIVTVWDDYSF